MPRPSHNIGTPSTADRCPSVGGSSRTPGVRIGQRDVSQCTMRRSRIALPGDVSRLTRRGSTSARAVTAGPWLASRRCTLARRRADTCRELLAGEQAARSCRGSSSNTGCMSVERAADHAQDLGRGRLLLERFLRLVEQPSVLDRDHRLVGEGLEQRELLVGERLGRLAQHADRADAAVLPQHRRPATEESPTCDRPCARAPVHSANRPCSGCARAALANRPGRSCVSSSGMGKVRAMASNASSRATRRHAPGRPRRTTKMPSCSVANRRSQLSRILSNTGAVSATELLITCSTSAVAVCCSSASLVSLNSRTFSMAMTAWTGERMQQVDLLVRENARPRRA